MNTLRTVCLVGCAAAVCVTGCDKKTAMAPSDTSCNTLTSRAPATAVEPGGKTGIFADRTDQPSQVVYVIDHSGSMVDALPMVQREVITSLGRLRANQDFHVIFYNGQPSECPPGRLTPATDANKDRAWRFVETIRARGLGNPVPALERAFAVLRKADDGSQKSLHFLSDGGFPDNNEVLSAVSRLNSDGRVKINTYLCGESPPVAVAIMKRIARENNGRYGYVISY